MEQLKFNFAKGDLELRSTDEHLMGSGTHTTAEIVQWSQDKNSSDKYCWTVAHWRHDSESFYLVFVGSRPFAENLDQEIFWELARKGDRILND